MSRLHFDSPVFVDPDDDSTTVHRQQLLSGWKVLMAGALMAGAVLGAFWLQRKVVLRGPEPIPVAEVQEQASREGKLVALAFGAPDDPDTARMLESWAGTSVQRLTDRRFVIHHIQPHMSEYPELATAHQVESVPAVVITSATGVLMRDAERSPFRLVGYHDADALRSFLALASSNDRPSRGRRPPLRPRHVGEPTKAETANTVTRADG